MIVKASVTLQHGLREVTTLLTDVRGIAVGNEYNLNLDGTIKAWKLVKIDEVKEKS